MSSQDLKELSGVIEQEIRIGESLLQNLAFQREAILAWDVPLLMSRIGERESQLRGLSELEERRCRVVKRLVPPAAEGLSLQEVTERFSNEPEAVRLRQLRLRAREIYVRIQEEEKRLAVLMESLLGHLREALRPLMDTAADVYGAKGVSRSRRPRAGLIQGKV